MPTTLGRRRFLREAGLIAGALAGRAMLAGCTPGAVSPHTPVAAPGAADTAASPAARRAGRLTLSWWTDIGFPSPFAFIPLGPGGIVRLHLLFDTLTWKDEHGIIPWLAERWAVSDDGRDYTFTVRSGIVWQDGRPLTATDIAFTFQYYREHPFKWGTSDMVERADATDARTVRLRLNRPYAPFLENVAGILPVLPKHVWERVSDPVKYAAPDATMGSGPFKLVSYKEGQGEYLFEAHAAYFRGRPLVDQLGYVLVPQAQRVVGLQTHAADTILSTDYDVVQSFGQGPTYRALQTPPFSIVRLLFNVDRAPFDQKPFRQAIAYALDRQQIGERVVHGNAVVGNPGVLPPGSPWYNPAVPQYPYDPAHARELLDGLGYRTRGDGLRGTPQGQPLTLEFLADPAAADVEIVRLMLRDVGIDVRLVTTDPKTRTQLLQDRRHTLALSAHIGVGGDPDFLRRWYADQAYNSFEYGNVLHNGEFTRLGDQQVAEADSARRKELVSRMQAILADELPTLALYHRPFYWLYDPQHWDRWFNTWGGLMDGIPLLDNKLSFLPTQSAFGDQIHGAHG